MTWLRKPSFPSFQRRWQLQLIALVVLSVTPIFGQDQSVDSDEFFDQQVLPILSAHCFKCHGGEAKIKGGLRLTSRDGILEGGELGPTIDLADPESSQLLEAINYEGLEMPPSGKLPPEQLAILARWVKLGAPWSKTTKDFGHHGDQEEPGGPQVDDAARAFWSFQPVTRPSLPAVSDGDWVRNPIDAFILRKLEANGLSPNPPADKVALLRRAYYGLTGLPPSPSDVKSFLRDSSDDAFERVIDRLLQSPQYGERWARHWLDLVRYAKSNSYERDGAKPFVWRYRDYVIRAFNDNKPYDEFVVEQLAGDELPEVTTESLIATGYYRLGLWQDEPVDPKQELYEDLDDLVRTTGEVFLGITIGCARCHDHKLDPIPQRDYYRFLSFFRNVRRYGVRSHQTVVDASLRPIGTEEEIRAHTALIEAHQEQVAQNRKVLGALDKKLRNDLVGVEKDEWKTEAARIELAKKRIGTLLTHQEFDRYVELTKKRDELRTSKPPGLDQALCVKEHGRTCPPTHVLVRGNAHATGEEVQPGFFSVLATPDPEVELPAAGIDSSGRRSVLARWIASPDNPLTARVIVNRIWQHHFGRGIVRSSSDFGFQGTPPTHRELLDWLASEFVAGGWRFKQLHKQIMLSSVYQMSSQANEAALAKDPTNDLFWRVDMRRLSAEEIRDSILAVNGTLNLGQMYGPSIYPRIPADVLAGQSRPGDGWGNSSAQERARRSIYIHTKRSLSVPMIASFDGADTDSSCPVRFNTTQPTQALLMLNSDFLNEQASRFVDFLDQHGSDEAADQVAVALWRILQRLPTASEVNRGVELLDKLRRDYQRTPQDALKQFCLIAYNLNEFVYLD